jgi:hypothetical protein
MDYCLLVEERALRALFKAAARTLHTITCCSDNGQFELLLSFWMHANTINGMWDTVQELILLLARRASAGGHGDALH